jgi:hypothetical protein
MGPTQRFDGKLPRSAWPASARRACPGPCSRLFDVHDRPRQATALTVGSTSASTCTHGRLRLLGRSNPPPVPISPSPIQSSPQHHRPETLFLDNTTTPARTTRQAPRQSLRPHLQNSTSSPGLVSSHHHNNLHPLPVAVSLSVVGSEPIVAPQTDLSRDIRTPAGAPQTSGPSIITPARPRLLNLSHHQFLIDDSFAIGLPAFTCCVRLDSSPPLLLGSYCPLLFSRPVHRLSQRHSAQTLLFVSFCESNIRQCWSSRTPVHTNRPHADQFSPAVPVLTAATFNAPYDITAPTYQLTHSHHPPPIPKDALHAAFPAVACVFKVY